jgi:uncharacterized protein YfdQ (DUF2303 family)
MATPIYSVTTSPDYTPAGPDGVQAIIDTAQAAAGPVALETGKVHVLALGRGQHTLVDLTGDKYRDAPARKTGTTVVRDVPSFLAYYDKHHDDASEVYADAEQLTVVAVLDAHAIDGARFGRHRLVLQLRKTDTWTAWARHSGHLMGQEDFAEHIQDRLAGIIEPTAASMLEVAQSISATTKASFGSGVRLHSGERQLTYTEETTAKAGSKGQLTIPEWFTLGLVPFEGAEGYKVGARFRYRIRDGHLTLGYKLDSPEDVLRTAFGDIRTLIDSGITEPVLNGTPA